MNTVPNDPPQKRKNKFGKLLSRYSTITKNILSSIKDLSIIIVVVIFILKPELIAGFLESHQVEAQEVKFFGIRLPFKSSLKELEYQGNLQQLAMVNLNTTDPALKKAATATLSTSSMFSEEIESNILTSKKFEKIQDWALVLSVHNTLLEAKNFISTMPPEEAATSISIYLKDDHYRVVNYFGSGELLTEAIPKIRKKFPHAFIVSIEKWCGRDDKQNHSKINDFKACQKDRTQ
ncbi:hypothetical protein JCM14076_24830 [Methylosoma difficile]